MFIVSLTDCMTALHIEIDKLCDDMQKIPHHDGPVLVLESHIRHMFDNITSVIQQIGMAPYSNFFTSTSSTN